MTRAREVLTLYWSEMRMALRERTIVVNSILIPLCLYPLMLWLTFTGIVFVEGQTEGYVARVAVQKTANAHAGFIEALANDDRFKLLIQANSRSAVERLRAGEIDGSIELVAAEGQAATLAGNFAVRLRFDKSKERSIVARDRLVDAIAGYRDRWLQSEAQARGVPVSAWNAFTIAERDVATGRQIGARVLSMILPVLFVVMVAIGCFYPAIDATAGERERGTWETLMSTAVSRGSIVVAKYLYVTSFGCLAGILNLAGMLATIRPVLAPMLARTGEHLEFAVSWHALPVLAAGAVAVGAAVAAGMMVFAAFARTFKDGQSMITPFFLLLMVPVFLVQDPEVTLTSARALVPVMNLALMVREAILGTFHWPEIVLALTVSTVLIVAVLRFAAFVLSFEDVVMGSYGGSFKTFLSERAFKRSRTSSGGERA